MICPKCGHEFPAPGQRKNNMKNETKTESESAPAQAGGLAITAWKFGGVHSRAVYDEFGRDVCKVSEQWQNYGGATRKIGNLIASAPALLAERDRLREALLEPGELKD